MPVISILVYRTVYMKVSPDALFLIIKPPQWMLRVTGQPQAHSACAVSSPLPVTYTHSHTFSLALTHMLITTLVM